MTADELRDAFRYAMPCRPCYEKWGQDIPRWEREQCNDCLDLALAAVAASGSPPSPEPVAQDEVTVRLPRKTAENSLVDAMARRDRYQQNMRDLDEGTEGSLMTPEELIYRRELTELIERWEGHCARLQDALEVRAASGSPPSPEKPIEWRAIAPMAWLQRRKGDVSNRPIMYAGPLDPRIVHDPGELWEWFALYSRKTIEAYLLAVRASSGSTGAPDDQPTPKDRPPMGSCLICGRLEVFAAWHSTYHVGVCTRCRDAGHLAGGLLHPPAPLAQPTREELASAILEHYGDYSERDRAEALGLADTIVARLSRMGL